MKNIPSKQLEPDYVSRFKCIGSACEDTCCHGWRVEIDRQTYEAYRRNDHPDLRPLMDKYVQRNDNEETASDEQYAVLQMTEEGSCPLLTEDKLCQIHKQLGEEALSTTCSQYPRTGQPLYRR